MLLPTACCFLLALALAVSSKELRVPSAASSALPWTPCTTVADCEKGQLCRPVPVNGNTHFCITPDSRANIPHYTCPVDHASNACCSNTDCQKKGGPSGVCVDAPSIPYCGGAPPPPWNACMYDACGNATNICGRDSSTCIPRGFYNFVVNTCVPGDGCVTASDCTAGKDGQCSFFASQTWCSVLTNVGCTYASSLCRSNADCPTSQVCQWVAAGGQTACMDAPQPPP